MKKTYLLPLLLMLLTACLETDNPVPKLDPRDSFIGSYQMFSMCTNFNGQIGQRNYSISIFKGLDPSSIEILNFFGTDQSLYADVNGNNFTLRPTAVTLNGNEYTVNGTGNLLGKSLGLQHIWVFQSQIVVSCTNEGNKL